MIGDGDGGGGEGGGAAGGGGIGGGGAGGGGDGGELAVASGPVLSGARKANVAESMHRPTMIVVVRAACMWIAVVPSG